MKTNASSTPATAHLLARVTVVALLTGALSGCAAFRAQVGAGFGMGAEVHLPVIAHLGLGIAHYKYAGHDYARGWCAGRRDGKWELSGMLLLHVKEYTDDGPFLHQFERKGGLSDPRVKHFCVGLAPLAADHRLGKAPSHSWEAGLAVHLLGFSLRLGFNPWYLRSRAGSESDSSAHSAPRKESANR